MRENIVKKKSCDFALGVIKLCKKLEQEKHFEISSQLIRSGTSIGANIQEALAGQSKIDSGMIEEKLIQPLINESEELIKILTSIVKTSSSKLPLRH